VIEQELQMLALPSNESILRPPLALIEHLVELSDRLQVKSPVRPQYSPLAGA
jgi:hypothetical protein